MINLKNLIKLKYLINLKKLKKRLNFFVPLEIPMQNVKISVFHYIVICYRFQTKFLSMFPFDTFFSEKLGEMAETARCELLLFTSLAIRSERMDRRDGRTCVDGSSMSHGFCHISIDVESSTHSPRPLLAVTPFVQL